MRRDPRYLWPGTTLFLLTALGFGLRVFDVADLPHGFFTDEAAAGLDAHSILTSGHDIYGNSLPFFFRSLNDYKLPVFIYAQVPFVAFLGLSEFTVRFTVVVMSTLTILVTYVLARRLYRNSPWLSCQIGALTAAAFLAIMPWHIHYGRTGFGELVSWPLLFTLGWFLALRAENEKRSLVPAALIFGLSFYTYRAAWVVLPLFLIVLALAHSRGLLDRFYTSGSGWLGSHRRDLLLSAGVFAIVLMPLARHLLFGPGDRATEVTVFDVQSEQSTLALLWDNYRSYFSMSFLFEDGDNGAVVRHYLPGQGQIYWFMAPLIIAGLLRVLIKREAHLLPLAALVLLYPLSGALSDQSPISSRTILGAVVFSLLAGLGVAWLIGMAIAWRPRYTLVTAGVAAGLLVGAGAFSLVTYVQKYFNEYPAVSAGYWGWQDGPEEILHRFVDLQAEYDDLFLDGTFNAPGVFIPFYVGDDCPKCRIEGLRGYVPTRRQLFAVRAENQELFNYQYRVRDVLLYPDQQPSFLLIEVTGKR